MGPRRETDRWDRWEPFGSNRGGKGPSRGQRPPSWAGPDRSGRWTHDLYEIHGAEEDGAEPWLPPRGMGSGRSSGSSWSGNCLVRVRNLDHAVTAKDLQQLFSK